MHGKKGKNPQVFFRDKTESSFVDRWEWVYLAVKIKKEETEREKKKGLQQKEKLGKQMQEKVTAKPTDSVAIKHSIFSAELSRTPKFAASCQNQQLSLSLAAGFHAIR